MHDTNKGGEMASIFERGQNGALYVWNWVKQQHPHNHLVAVDDDDLDLEAFFKAKGIAMGACYERQHSYLKQIDDDYETIPGGSKTKSKDLRSQLQNGSFTVEYGGVHYIVYVFDFSIRSRCSSERIWLLSFPGNDECPGRKLIADAFAWQDTLKNEMWVFHGSNGGWRKDKDFHRSVMSAKAGDIILPHVTMKGLLRDTSKFFESAALYKSLGVTWKRGILLMGPPGNGKTGVIKLLLQACADVPALYVQSAKHDHGAEHAMQRVFAKARREAPCILILEDIDTLVQDDSRTFMLNQLDGIEPNDGILVIGTANDPSKLDRAILHRPSRFDTKYIFPLPDATQRKHFIDMWLEKKIGLSRLLFDVQKSPANVHSLSTALVDRTDGWSFAFLKELFVSFLLGVASQNTTSSDLQATATPEQLLHHLDLLQAQTQAL